MHEPCGDGTPHGRERHLFHACGRGGSGCGEDIALADAATVAGGCECGEINAMLFGGAAGAGTGRIFLWHRLRYRLHDWLEDRVADRYRGLNMWWCCWERWRSSYRHRLTFCEQVAEHVPDFDNVARLGTIGCDVQEAAIDGFNFLRGFIAFKREERIAFFDEVAIFLQPGEELALLHGPAETG